MPLGSAKHRSDSVVRSSPTRAQRGTRPKKFVQFIKNIYFCTTFRRGSSDG
ncbi:MAG: hypothetical protein NZ455_05250 [Bacteroidia bacterium]|nr:hypothetical protein [Bacteroidia bacterium]